MFNPSLQTPSPSTLAVSTHSPVPAHACPLDANHSDAPAWEQAGQAWRIGCSRCGTSDPLRQGRIRLVNTVLMALKKFERGNGDAEELAEALHGAVARFNQRAA